MDDATLLRSFNFRITHFGEKSNYYISLTLFASNMTDNANSDSFLCAKLRKILGICKYFPIYFLQIEQPQLLRLFRLVRTCLDKHLSEQMEQDINHDAVTCEFILSGIAYTDLFSLYLVNIAICDTHKTETLARS